MKQTIPNGSKVSWRGVNRREHGIVVGYYHQYIVRLPNGMHTLIDERNNDFKLEEEQ